MNGEPFYDNSRQRWRPPSPKSTPQSAKFAFFPVDPSYASNHSPDQQYGWMSSQTPLTTPIDRPLQPHGSVNQIASYVPTVPSQNSQPEFSSGSFVEHFSSTTLDDPFTDPAVMTSSTPTSQMRTPPPTRDDSNRRKSQQHRILEFQTPSTIASRRVAPHDSWQGQSAESLFPAPSPFTFTPLQFSPAPQFGFTPSGPMTAPALTQPGLFWEPNNNHTMSQMSFSSIAEEPFARSFGVNVGNHGSQYVFGTATPLNTHVSSSDILQSQMASTNTVLRPQSARPADSRAGPTLAKASVVSSNTGVDPNMLWNIPSVDNSSFADQDGPLSSKSGGAEERQAYKPYQHQLETLKAEKRDKEQQLKNSRGTLSQSSLEIPQPSALSGLQRSLTDGKSRKGNVRRYASYSHAPSSDSNPLLSSQTTLIHRESSPLKRHRSISQVDHLTPTKARARRSVVLTVDEQGHARTEVKQLGDDSTSAPVFPANRSQDGFSDSSDVSDPVLRLPMAASSSEPSPGPSDAANALREAVRIRRLNRKSDIPRQTVQTGSDNYHVQDVLSSRRQRNSGSSYSNNSPTTITDPEFSTPTADRHADLERGIRCLCGGRASENLTIECESCKHRLHVACLGLNPKQIPSVFVCVFCTGSTPTARGGHIRTYSNSNFQRFSGQYD